MLHQSSYLSFSSFANGYFSLFLCSVLSRVAQSMESRPIDLCRSTRRIPTRYAHPPAVSKSNPSSPYAFSSSSTSESEPKASNVSGILSTLTIPVCPFSI